MGTRPLRLRRWARRAAAPACALLAVVALAAPMWAEDSDQLRYYAHILYEDIGTGLTRAHDGAGLSIGANVGRHLGFEFALDAYDVKVGELSEMQVLALTPQIRLRYPLLADRLVPYAIGGAGLSVTQPNDARTQVDWTDGKTEVHPSGILGGGIEYFIADNIALGLEMKYVFSGAVQYTSGDAHGEVHTSSWLAGGGVRVFYPELHPDAGAEAARNARARFYLALRTGAALLVNLEPFPGVHATPEQSLAGSNFTPMFGAALGAAIGRYAAVELSLQNYELKLGTADLGGIGEYAVFPVTVQGRLRYPLLRERLVPYLGGGAGAEFAEINDRADDLIVTAKDITPIGTFLVGADYYVMSNVSLGAGMQYTISRGHTLQLDNGPVLSGNLDSFFLTLALKVDLFGV